MSTQPLPRICHGVDLVDIERLREVMARSPAFEARVFTEGERAYCHRRADPAQHFAARFAAKEATLKALGSGLMAQGIDASLREIEVERESGPPRLVLHGKPAKVARRLGLGPASLSLSHAGGQAVASVVMWGWAPEPEREES